MSPPDLLPVRLQQLPLRHWAAAKQHNDELLREFTLMSAARAEGTASDDVPERLISLIDTLRQRYGAGTGERDARLFAALAAGAAELDVDMALPAAAGPAVQQLGALLDEADEYCGRGQHLLTLATPPELVAFRRWYLDEIAGQLAGAPPTPWPLYAGT